MKKINKTIVAFRGIAILLLFLLIHHIQCQNKDVANSAVAGSVILNENFEKLDKGWIFGSIQGHTEWRVQSGAAYEGSFDCGTYDLKNNIAHGYCNSCGNDYVDLSRYVDLTDYSSANLSFFFKCKGDMMRAGMVLIDEDVITEELYNSTDWKLKTINLDKYCGAKHLLIFRFSIFNGGATKNPGFTLDNIKITGIPGQIISKMD